MELWKAQTLALLLVAICLFREVLSLPPSITRDENTTVSQNAPTLGTFNSGIANSTGEISPGSPDSRMEVIPLWIQKTRERATKVLERPLDSQLEFHEGLRGSGMIFRNEDDEDADRENGRLRNRVLPFPSLGNSSPGSIKKLTSGFNPDTQVPVVRVAGVQKQNVKETSSSSAVGDSTEQKKNTKRKEPVRKQDLDLVARPLQFAHVVSPLEASLGGFTGLQGLPPLSFIQFTKLLVAITPFILPMIFIPLLIFTIGLLMLPVTRSNVFVDVGDFRGGSASPRHHSWMSTSTSLLSNYVISPVKNFAGNVVMPRAYEFANDFIENEECVERISCEISARYLQRNTWDDGSWRNFANRSWAAGILNYFWNRLRYSHSTVGRIAKSLDVLEMEWPGSETTSGEFGKRGNSTAAVGDGDGTVEGYGLGDGRRKNGLLTRSSPVPCKRYTCQPKNLLRKIFAFN